VWPDNADARAGLLRATLAVAEYELACGDARAAVTLLSELEEKPALLATAQAAAAAQATRQQALEELGRDADPTVARATRLIIVPLCLLFVILPLISGLRPDMGWWVTARSSRGPWAASSCSR